MDVPLELLDKAGDWDKLKRWQRRELGQELRLLGLSYAEIRAIVPAAKSTLSGWCRDIPLTSRQIERIRSIGGNSEVGRAKAAVKLRTRNKGRTEAIRRAAREEAEHLQKDPFWVAGVIAYWAEGAKRVNKLHFSNSDPKLVVLFIEWAIRFLDLSVNRFVIALHLHEGQDEQERREFWWRVTRIPTENFRKTFIKPEGTGHRKNILYNGTASIRITRSTDLLHRVLGWIDFLSQSYSGIG
jgi:hypothetical protein